ncbi:hypothetical protein EGW08_017650 [Elysia chlorotica]|uniref:Mitochondrial cardiolipin hydrolase n=1 Tax=Elysia chlorotica TaxID=188477 RepID=A0A3S1B8F8_ELYCH|nr:hypothetical protein EGW08_017650 [Elysia chlorotica]
MDSALKGSIYTILFFFTSELLYKLYRKVKDSRHVKSESESNMYSRKQETTSNCSSLKVLFFPDSKIACRDHFITGNGCYKDICAYSHSDTALSELYKHMLACKSTLDVCVFVVTCKDLADVLARLFRRGVKVRIITDKEQLQASGSQIWTLMKDGIPVRTNDSSYLMHHKFALIDGKVLINGSFNWTRQAITGNQENLIITDDSSVTQLFMREFQKLWEQYDPKNIVAGFLPKP